MRNVSDECIKKNCPCVCGDGFPLSDEGFEELKKCYKNCEYASNCSYMQVDVEVFSNLLSLNLEV